MEQLRLEGHFEDDLVQSFRTHSKLNQSRLPRTVSSQVLNITKGGDSAASLGNQFQCLTNLPIEKGVYVHTEFLYLYLLFLSFYWAPLRQAVFFILPGQIYTLMRSPEPSFLQSQVPQLFLVGQMFHCLNHLPGPLLDSF